MPTPDFPVGVPSWYTDEQLRGYVGMLAQRLFNLLCNLDSLNVTRLDAGTVQVYDLNGGTGTITLTGDGMTINNGTYNTFTVDVNGNVTMTSATIQSQSGYPKVVMDPSGNLFAAYVDADNYVRLTPSTGGGPGMSWTDSGSLAAYMAYAAGLIISTFGANKPMTLSPTGTLFLSPGSNLNLQPSGNLQINSANGYSGTFSVITSVNFATQTTTSKNITINQGIITNVV
jgi:hypothetical protein